MDRHVNYTIVGAFVLAGLIGIFAFLALLIFNDKVELWHVLVITFIQGGADGIGLAQPRR